MKKNCGVCGEKLVNEYNPYNITFNKHQCKENDRKMCEKCARRFVESANKCKGGRWVVCVGSEIGTFKKEN
jgi:hypothetical protein